MNIWKFEEITRELGIKIKRKKLYLLIGAYIRRIEE